MIPLQKTLHVGHIRKNQSESKATDGAGPVVIIPSVPANTSQETFLEHDVKTHGRR